MKTKKDFLNNLVDGHIRITKILSWSLTSIPDGLLTADTMVLLPNKFSSAYIDRAHMIGYSPENILKSYERCTNLKLFDGSITKSIIFLNDN